MALSAKRKPTETPSARVAARPAREVSINLRASRKERTLIDRAAEAIGKSRSDFMLEAACREAESVLLDRTFFALDAEAFKAFTAMLDRPPVANSELRRLLTEKAPWDK